MPEPTDTGRSAWTWTQHLETVTRIAGVLIAAAYVSGFLIVRACETTN